MQLGLRIAALLLLAAVFTGCATSQVFYRPYDEVKAGMEKMAKQINTQSISAGLLLRTNAVSDLTVEELRVDIQARRATNASNRTTNSVPRLIYGNGGKASFKEIRTGQKAVLHINESPSSKFPPITILEAFPRGSRATTVTAISRSSRDRAREVHRLKQLIAIVPPGQPYKKFVP